MFIIAIIAILLFTAYHLHFDSPYRPFFNVWHSAAVVVILWALTPATVSALMLCGLLAFVTLQFVMPLADPRPSRWMWQAGRLQVAMVVA